MTNAAHTEALRTYYTDCVNAFAKDQGLSFGQANAQIKAHASDVCGHAAPFTAKEYCEAARDCVLEIGWFAGNIPTPKVTSRECDGCDGSGRHPKGECFRCGGKGYQTAKDSKRNQGYDRYNKHQ